LANWRDDHYSPVELVASGAGIEAGRVRLRRTGGRIFRGGIYIPSTITASQCDPPSAVPRRANRPRQSSPPCLRRRACPGSWSTPTDEVGSMTRSVTNPWRAATRTARSTYARVKSGTPTPPSSSPKSATLDPCTRITARAVRTSEGIKYRRLCGSGQKEVLASMRARYARWTRE
jgi:hypothetical protein